MIYFCWGRKIKNKVSLSCGTVTYFISNLVILFQHSFPPHWLYMYFHFLYPLLNWLCHPDGFLINELKNLWHMLTVFLCENDLCSFLKITLSLTPARPMHMLVLGQTEAGTSLCTWASVLPKGSSSSQDPLFPGAGFFGQRLLSLRSVCNYLGSYYGKLPCYDLCLKASNVQEPNPGKEK